MKQKLLLLIFALLIMKVYAQNQKFTPFNVNTAFTAIAVDGQNKRVWAGTRQGGVFKIDSTGVSNEIDFTRFDGSDPVNGPPLGNIRISSMAADGLGNIWIGHQGTNFSGGQGGMERINSALNIKHYHSETNYTYNGLSYNRRDGLATRRITSVSVDKNNKVWSAHKYTDLTSGSLYILQPGAFSYKAANSPLFTTVGGWKPGRLAGQPAELPYPAYTYQIPATASPGARIMDAISCDDTRMYVAVRGYSKKVTDSQADGGYIPHRVLVYNLDGTPTGLGNVPNYGGFSYEEMAFPTGGGIVNGICANNSIGTWFSKSFTGAGFSVYRKRNDGVEVWEHLDPTNYSQIIPPSTRFNTNAMWKDKAGRVFMGTDKGLIVYSGGKGDVTDINSYKLYTNYDYGAAAGNTHNIHDVDMISSNIKGGYADPNNINVSWIVTDNGIMKLFLPIEGMVAYHVNEHFTYSRTTVDDENNITFLTKLNNQVGLVPSEPEYASELEYPIVAADGSGSTIFRFDTVDGQGFYDGINGISSKYHIYVGPGGDVATINSTAYIDQYGQFILKDLSSYIGSPASAADLTYIEVEYIHPKYIEESTYVAGENYAITNYIIKDVQANNTEILFTHPIKIEVPPVLLGHGVWSSVSSMEGLETYLFAHGFSEDNVMKAWRTIDAKDLQNPENSFEEDSWVIPTYIKNLKDKAVDNLFSVGKVNVIVHSRGGLYTRGYIEAINPTHRYIDDVNSLITIDTPHFGSQGGNVALDRRVVVYKETLKNAFVAISTLTHIPVNILIEANDITVGFIASAASVPKRDNPRNGAEGKNWGARNLIVEDDNISGVVPPEDPGFISRLNSTSSLARLHGTPIHTISAIADPCIDSPWFCLDTEVIAETSKIQAKFALIVKKMLPNAMSEGLRSVTQALFNGEPNDFIVPLTSMQGGLGGTRYNTPFGLSDNLDHTGMFREGVAKATVVHDRILQLLKSNVYDETNNGFFTQTGLVHPQGGLTYNFLATVLDPALQRRNVPFDSKILINRDPAIFDNVVEGDIVNFNVYQENVDSIMVTYESENDSENFTYTTKSQNLVFENPFSYTIPEGYSGELKITAYGFKNGVVGYAISTVTLEVGTPLDVTLQGIHFETQAPIILNQNNYRYKVIGTYSDGINRVLNNADLTFTIEDSSISSQVDNSTIKGEQEGSTLFTVSLNEFEDTVLVTVQSNPSLQQTILTSFYGIPDNTNTTIAINWETLREYQNATFVLETSYGTPDNFTEINNQAGNGTTEIPAQFNYNDSAFGSNTLIYYRIKMIDTQGNITYSSTIEINLASSLGVDDNNIENTNLKLYPNPTNTDKVTLQLNSNFTDKNAKLEMYSLQGKRLSVQTINVVEGTNSFNLKIGEGLVSGIYLVKVSTKGYVKTIKLVVNK